MELCVVIVQRDQRSLQLLGPLAPCALRLQLAPGQGQIRLGPINLVPELGHLDLGHGLLFGHRRGGLRELRPERRDLAHELHPGRRLGLGIPRPGQCSFQVRLERCPHRLRVLDLGCVPVFERIVGRLDLGGRDLGLFVLGLERAQLDLHFGLVGLGLFQTRHHVAPLLVSWARGRRGVGGLFGLQFVQLAPERRLGGLAGLEPLFCGVQLALEGTDLLNEVCVPVSLGGRVGLGDQRGPLEVPPDLGRLKRVFHLVVLCQECPVLVFQLLVGRRDLDRRFVYRVSDMRRGRDRGQGQRVGCLELGNLSSLLPCLFLGLLDLPVDLVQCLLGGCQLGLGVGQLGPRRGKLGLQRGYGLALRCSQTWVSSSSSRGLCQGLDIGRDPRAVARVLVHPELLGRRLFLPPALPPGRGLGLLDNGLGLGIEIRSRVDIALNDREWGKQIVRGGIVVNAMEAANDLDVRGRGVGGFGRGRGGDGDHGRARDGSGKGDLVKGVVITIVVVV